MKTRAGFFEKCASELKRSRRLPVPFLRHVNTAALYVLTVYAVSLFTPDRLLNPYQWGHPKKRYRQSDNPRDKETERVKEIRRRL